MIKKIIAVFACFCILWVWLPAASATKTEAQDISASTTFSGDGFDNFQFLIDGNKGKYKSSAGNCHFTLFNENGIGSLYLMFDLEYGEYIVENAATGEQITAGTNGFLHEYLDLAANFQKLPTSVTLHFERGAVRLSEITVYSKGTVPAEVQRWDAPLEGKTDLLLLSTHGDDDQLFFAGLLPLYAAEKKAAVQVAYLTDHRNLTNQRTHEILNGLWAVGCTAYPVMGRFPDFRIDDLNGTYAEFERQGYSQEKLSEFVVGLLRRFKPQVVVGHDINGEYGHGMHMAYTDCLIKALDISTDETAFPALAEQYGLWEVPKTYLHLYKQNPIVLDYDQPLAAFEGMSAFEVSQKLGYPCHKSQQYTWFTDWINGSDGQITKATQIRTYNPCHFGLYRSTVGIDQQKNDVLENIVTYAEQARIEQERLEAERLEKERLEQERLEKERLELERLEQERAEQQRQEQERLEKERLEQLRLQQEQLKKQQKRMRLFTGVGIAAVIAALIPVLVILFRKTISGVTDQ